MSEYQAIIIGVIFIFLTSVIAISIALDRIWGILKDIKHSISAITKQNTDNKNDISSGDGKDK